MQSLPEMWPPGGWPVVRMHAAGSTDRPAHWRLFGYKVGLSPGGPLILQLASLLS